MPASKSKTPAKSKGKPAPKTERKRKRPPPKLQTLPVKFGEALEIDASPDNPKWIAATKHHLHVHVPDPESRFALFKDSPPTLILARVVVTEPSGHASHVIVTTTRPRGGRKAA